MPLFDTTVESVTTTGFVTYIGNVLSALLGWVVDVFETIVSSPVVLVFVILAVIGAVVAFAKKILM